MSRFSVALIDDHPVLTGALASVLAAQPDVATVFTAASLDEGRRLLARERPELAVIDVRLDRDDGLALLRELPLVSPRTRAVVLTAHPGRGGRAGPDAGCAGGAAQGHRASRADDRAAPGARGRAAPSRTRGGRLRASVDPP